MSFVAVSFISLIRRVKMLSERGAIRFLSAQIKLKMIFQQLFCPQKSIFFTIVSEVSNELSCSEKQFNMVHIGRVLICALLVCAMLFSFTQPPVAHAEAVTVTIAVIGSILALIAASYGLTVTYGSVDAAVRDFWEAEAQDFISRSPTWSQVELSTLGVAWLSSRLENPSMLLDDLTISFCNDFFYDWCNTKHNIQEGVVTPVTVGDMFYNTLTYTTVPSGKYDTLAEALAILPFTPYAIPFDNGILNVYQDNGTLYFYNGTTRITTFSIANEALYFYVNYAGGTSAACRVLYYNSGATHPYGFATATGGVWKNSLTSVQASIPDTYTDQTVPQVDYGTALTYTGAPDTTYEDFLDTGIEEILLDTYDPTLTEDIPWDEPVPTPAIDTTWEDGALGFWQAVGGAVTGGLSTAGQSVRQWIQSMHAQMVAYWEALLEWCDGIVGAIEGAEDGFIRGIINEITTVFASAKNTIRSALGIWHYVVEWVQSITTPFSLFLGLAGRVSPYLTLPIYASLAGLVILGVYKKFIG